MGFFINGAKILGALIQIDLLAGKGNHLHTLSFRAKGPLFHIGEYPLIILPFGPGRINPLGQAKRPVDLKQGNPLQFIPSW